MTRERKGGTAPIPVAPLVGRNGLLRQAVARVQSHRLVTLTGVGGVGKTRLALEVGRELEPNYADGVWLVELAPVRDEASVPGVLASVLGITPQGDAPLIDTVAEAMAGRHLLVVIDNCEHVLPAAALAVRNILSRSETIRVLCTSREALDLAGEQRIAVPPLALDGGGASDAVALFVERAGSVRPGFSMEGADTAEAVVQICATLDGLPLGIELAAARMAAMSPADVRDRLGDRFRLLRGPTHGPVRQQTLRDLVRWSYDLLEDGERVVLCATAAFSGGLDLAGLTAVVHPGGDRDDEVTVLTLLDSLVRKSLITVEHGAARTRYRVLETIRQFAEDELSAAGGLERVRDRHAAHFGREVAARWEQWGGPAWGDTVGWVELELANLRAAFQWSAARGELDVATDVAAHAALIGYSGQLFETVAWAESLLEAATAANVRRLPRLCAAAGYACFTGRPGPALVHARRASELAALPGYDPCPPGITSFTQALCEVYCGHLDRYLELTEALAAMAGPARAFGLPAFVDGLQASGRVDEALALVEEAVAAAHEAGNPFWVAYALWTAGLALANRDRPRALAAWSEGVAYIREHGVHFFEGFIARDAARLHSEHGEADEALTLFASAVESFQRDGNVTQLLITVACVPQLLERIGRPSAAGTLLGAVARHPASAHHVPELEDVASRLAGKLGEVRWAELSAAGAALELADAAVYAREQIDDARRALLGPTRRRENPGRLTKREMEVLRLVADGLTTPEIARQLFISAKTADHHVEHIYTKIGATNRPAATRWALAHGVIGDARRAASPRAR